MQILNRTSLILPLPRKNIAMPQNLLLFSRRLGRRPNKGFGVIAVEVEEEFQALQFRLESRRAIAEIDGGAQGLMGIGV